MDEQNFHFSDKERAFFSVRIDEINRLMQSLDTAAKLIVFQNDLPGDWQVKLDGSGLNRIN